MNGFYLKAAEMTPGQDLGISDKCVELCDPD
jgi:hypothetical protein